MQMLFEDMGMVLVAENGQPLYDAPPEEAGNNATWSARVSSSSSGSKSGSSKGSTARGPRPHPHYPCPGLAWSNERYVFT